MIDLYESVNKRINESMNEAADALINVVNKMYKRIREAEQSRDQNLITFLKRSYLPTAEGLEEGMSNFIKDKGCIKDPIEKQKAELLASTVNYIINFCKSK